MPDQLTEELARAREDLARRIRRPGLDGARQRARILRRRRRGLAAVGTALAGVVLAAAAMLLGTGPDRATGPAATATGAGGPAWQGSGITLHGLDGSVVDQPGDIGSLQFNDPDHGFVLTVRCQVTCVVAVAATTDGGHGWTDWPLAQSDVGNVIPALIPVGRDAVVLRGQTTWYGRAGTWHPVPTTNPPTVTAIPDGAALAVSSGIHDTPPGTLEVWRPDGSLAILPAPDGFIPYFAEPNPAGDGSWWLGGATGGQPAVSRSVDNGRSWWTFALPVAGRWARISTVGREAYAAVETVEDGSTVKIEAVYRSIDGGPFSLYAQRLGPVVGEVVPLLDGRLLVAGPDWYVGTGPLTRASGTLPWVGQLQRTPGGWVALDLFQAGWAAVSRDGLTWRKVNVR